jgi:hypothetical protein
MKSFSVLLLLVIGLCATATSARIVQYPDGLVLDTRNDDVTVQELPAMGKGKFLCLWTGDLHLAFVTTLHEKYEGDLKTYLALTERSAAKSGGKNIKMTEGANFKTADKREVRRYDMTFYAEGEFTKSIYYLVKTDSGYYSVVVTMVDPAAYSIVRSRTDKMLAAAVVNLAKAQ